MSKLSHKHRLHNFWRCVFHAFQLVSSSKRQHLQLRLCIFDQRVSLYFGRMLHEMLCNDSWAQYLPHPPIGRFAMWSSEYRLPLFISLHIPLSTTFAEVFLSFDHLLVECSHLYTAYLLNLSAHFKRTFLRKFLSTTSCPEKTCK